MRVRATIDLNGATATGMRIPSEVVETLGSGKRPPVRVTINGYTYRSTVAVMGGEYLIGVSAENRAGAGVAAGDEVDVEIELDTEPREVTLPADFAAALDAEPAARQTFDRLSYSNRSWHVLSIGGAKTEETRQRRVAPAPATAVRDPPVRGVWRVGVGRSRGWSMDGSVTVWNMAAAPLALVAHRDPVTTGWESERCMRL